MPPTQAMAKTAIAFTRLAAVLDGMGLSTQSVATTREPQTEDVYPEWALRQLHDLDAEFATYAIHQSKRFGTDQIYRCASAV